VAKRDENGRWLKGHSGNPNGRPKKEREERYYEILMTACTFKDWRAIIKVAVEQAKDGDAQARKWLSDYLIGPAPQEIKGDIVLKWPEDGDPTTAPT
jgi:hypothetical protein